MGFKLALQGFCQTSVIIQVKWTFVSTMAIGESYDYEYPETLSWIYSYWFFPSAILKF
jgi:hypothetical protein